MAIDDILHPNEYGLPLNTAEWLEKHHQSKVYERKQMIRDLGIKQGSFVIDAGCGPGLWIPLLVKAVGPTGRVLGVDISTALLISAQQRVAKTSYHHQVQYKLACLEHLPVRYGEADLIFCANVSQYFANPVATFAALGPYLKQRGRLVVKDMNSATMRFSHVNADLQHRVFQARARWDQERVAYGYAFEDGWVGSKLAGYLRAAGYKDVQEKRYRIERRFPLSEHCRFYLQGMAQWLVSEGAPYLSQDDKKNWLQYFSDSNTCVLDLEDFAYEESEYVIYGVWNANLSHRSF
jgi:ubiquinone/menaquinone biosynthesis C-methylase UbiE